MPRRARPAALVAVAVCAWGTVGCSDDAEPPAGDGPNVDEVASSWGEITSRAEERTRSYLDGEGSALLEYAGFADGLAGRLDDAAYDDRCAGLRAEWDESFPPRRLLDWLHGLPDPILGRLWTSQVTSIDEALAGCADGAPERGAEAAEQVDRLQELVDRRLGQLGVER